MKLVLNILHNIFDVIILIVAIPLLLFVWIEDMIFDEAEGK